MPAFRASFISLSVLTLAACTTQPVGSFDGPITEREKQITEALGAFSGDYPVSENALLLAVKDTEGKPVGLFAYENPSDALKAGDIAAFIAAIKAGEFDQNAPGAFPALVIAIDAAAAGDFQRAIDTLEPAKAEPDTEAMAGFIEAWTLALSGQQDKAIRTHRRVGANLPGMTGDLSLAAMLEAFGRTEEALSVYSALVPTRIVAPEHDFDPQGLVYSHVQTVIARQAILLRDLGRIEEAQTLYRRLAEAEPEEAVRFEAAIDSLATGRGLDTEELTVERAFSQALGDYSLSMTYQRIIANAMTGVRERDYDTFKGMFEQLALVIDPSHEDMRLAVFDDLFDQNLFAGALHVLQSAPEATAQLKLAEATTLLRMDDFPGADKSLTDAIELSDEDEKLGISTAAMRIYALKKNEARALPIANSITDFAQTPAEKAAAHAMAGGVYAQFGKHDRALIEARAAQAIEDTHDRRMSLATALADAGEIEEGLLILRTEALARPNDPYMLNSLGYYLVLHTDRLDEAYKVLARASALAPNDSYIADSFGWVRFMMGDLEGARRYIELSQRELLPQRHWEIEDHLGDVYWHLGREEDAKTAWANALAEFPPADERPAIENKLANGIDGPPPEKRPLPDVSLSDDAEIDRNDI